MGTPYKGGLQITAVRNGSEAAARGIQLGDVLVGIHEYQTTSINDLAGILDHPDIKQGSRAKFYVVRREQTLFGHFQLAARDKNRLR